MRQAPGTAPAAAVAPARPAAAAAAAARPMALRRGAVHLAHQLAPRGAACHHPSAMPPLAPPPGWPPGAAAAAGRRPATSARSSGDKARAGKAGGGGGDCGGGGGAAARGGTAAGAGAAPAGGRTLMVVESPTKAHKIQAFLGSGYNVVASYGHVRDLAAQNGSVRPDEDFELTWRVPAAAEERLAALARASAGARALVLATDPDREGEAISWHIAEELKRRGVLPRPGLPVHRVTFTEVTSKAVKEALQAPREISASLVDAYLARRALDYLVGFGLSPLLWRRLCPAARSAGRVQSVALRLVCDREDERQLFQSREYWSIGAAFSAQAGAAQGAAAAASAAALPARLASVDGRRLGKMDVSSGEQAEGLARRLWGGLGPPPLPGSPAAYRVAAVGRRRSSRAPQPPYVTSTLQQDAARRLGFGASKTMQVAQQLYEGTNTGEGLITYMRTDGVSVSAEAAAALRGVIGEQYGERYLPPGGPRAYATRAKNAQEAHEAIRPTDAALLPQQAAAMLTPDQAKLYSLIWRRAVASQMASAELLQVSAELHSPCGGLVLRSSGSSVEFPGFMAAWEGLRPAAPGDGGDGDGGASAAADAAALASDDEGGSELPSPAAAGGLSALLQRLEEGQQVHLVEVTPAQHATQPPPRYTEASMVKALEEAGVGRPSTYAPIIRLLLDRGYVIKGGGALVPTPLGRLLTAYLALHFPEYVDVNFTAKVEEQLDEVSAGALPWKRLMAEFNEPLERAIAEAQKQSITEVFNGLEGKLEPLIFTALPPPAGGAGSEPQPGAAPAAPAAADPRVCPVCGGRLVLKPSRSTGGFIGCSNHASLGCNFGRPLWPDAEERQLLSDEEDELGGQGGGAALGASKLLGHDPASGEAVTVRRGPYGLYVQLGGGIDAAAVAEAAAAAAAAAAQHPSEAEVPAPADGEGAGGARGRLKAARPPKPPAPPRAAVPRGLGWADITLEVALGLLALPRTVGVHPDDGEPVTASVGRFGPYLRHRTLFAPLPKGTSPQEVALDQALEVLAAKASRLRARGRDPYEVKVRPGKRAAKARADGKAAKASGGRAGRKAAKATGSSSRAGAARGSGGAKALSGYNLFCRERRADVVGAAAGAGVGGGSGGALKLLAAAWRQLTAEQQADFAARAREMSAANAPPPASEGSGLAAGPGANGASNSRSHSNGRANGSGSSRSNRGVDGSSSSGGGSSGGSRSSSRRRTTSSRPASGYQLFCKERRAAVLQQHPGAKPSEVLTLLGAAWRELGEEQQAEWSLRAAVGAAAEEGFREPAGVA